LAALSLLANDLNLQSQASWPCFYGIYATYAASLAAAVTEAVGGAVRPK